MAPSPWASATRLRSESARTSDCTWSLPFADFVTGVRLAAPNRLAVFRSMIVALIVPLPRKGLTLWSFIES